MDADQKILKSFLPVSEDSHFPIQNIPFGVFYPNSDATKTPRCGTRIGDNVIDLAYLESKNYFTGPLFSTLAKENKRVFNQRQLNEFMSLEREYWREARKTIQDLFQEGSPLSKETSVLSECVYPIKEVTLCLPAQIGDFTDFNSSKHHSYNMGLLLRGYKEVQQNWLRLPIGYAGRSSSVVISGAKIPRPRGQAKLPDQNDSEYIASKKLDFEMELGFFLGGKLNNQGTPLTTAQVWDHIFGFVMLNDWSARDLQTWEYVPLGPLNSKNFNTTISPWIVTLDAFEEFRVKLPVQEPEPHLYLKDENMWGYDITMETLIKTSKSDKYEPLCKSNYKYLHWTIPQQVAHHTVSGCNLRPGDLVGSGACSGPEEGEYGTFVELSWNGKKPFKLSTGEERTFCEDGDSILLTGYSKSKNGYIIGFGECEGTILPAVDLSIYEKK